MLQLRTLSAHTFSGISAFSTRKFISALSHSPSNGFSRNAQIRAASSDAFPQKFSSSSSSSNSSSSSGSSSKSLSDIIWPSAGAFAAMAIMSKVHNLLEPKGLFFLIAPFGAVCCTLFATPDAPAARVYNVLAAHLGCCFIGVCSLAIFGTGWQARSVALAASLAFMELARCPHPAAAGLPLLFLDAPKLQALNWRYVLFPSAAGCLILLLLKPVVKFVKENIKF